MTTDYVRRNRAIELRKQGLSIKAIAKRLPAAQSSVSIWTRGVRLSDEQKKLLKGNTHTPEVIEKRRQARLRNESKKRALIISASKADVKNINNKELWLIGVSLYWAEGGKTQSIVRFSNGDPRMIKIMMQFFEEVCKVDKSKIRGHIHLHESLSTADAEKYWRKVTRIPKARFYKTYNKPNKSSKGTRNTLPFGVCDIYVLDAKLLLKIKGWIEGIYEHTQKV